MNQCFPKKSTPPFRSALKILAATLMAATPLLAEPAGDGYIWEAMNSGTTRTLHKISVVDKDFAVAAGTHGTLLVYSNGAWNPMTDWSDYNPYSVDSSQLTVTALSPNNVWIGSYGTTSNNKLVKWDGTNFSSSVVTGARTTFMTNVGGIVLAGRGENYVSVSSNPVTPTPTFTNFKLPAAIPSQLVISVAGNSDSNLWAANLSETFQSTDFGATWISRGVPTLGTGESLRAMAVSTNETLWLGTNLGQVFSKTANGDFGAARLSLDFFIRDIYARDDQNVWFVGDGGNLWYYNGTTASKIDLGTTNAFYSISGTDDGIWISGANGAIYQAIPEPSTVAIAMAGVCCFAGYRFLRLK